MGELDEVLLMFSSPGPSNLYSLPLTWTLACPSPDCLIEILVSELFFELDDSLELI